MSASAPVFQIQRTVVSPDADGTFVELHIVDATQPREPPATQITLSIRLASYESPLLAQLEHEALLAAMRILQAADQGVQQTIRAAGLAPDVPPRPGKP